MRVSIWNIAMMAGVGGVFLASSLAWAQARTGASPFDHQPETRLACDRLKAQIAQTIRDNGARHFLLEIVDNAQVEDDVVKTGEPFAGAEVVGSCDGGTRKVVYSRNGATEMSEPSAGGSAQTVRSGQERSGGEPHASMPESSGDPVPGEPKGDSMAQEPESSP